jgi:ribA/ribD-fused uncharacterized protein
LEGLLHLLNLERAKSKAVPYHIWPTKIFIHCEENALSDLRKIDTFHRILLKVGSYNNPSNLYYPSLPSLPILPTLPSKMSSAASAVSTSSNAVSVSAIAIQVDLLSAEVKTLSERLTAALAAIAASSSDSGSDKPKKRTRKGKAKVSESTNETDATEGNEGNEGNESNEETKQKKARKPREPKEKPSCPAAGEGVIRFYSSAGDSAYKSFSNLAKFEFELEGKNYYSVEHYFQSEKFSTTDSEYSEKIRTQKNPVLVKGMGRSKAHPIPEDWDSKKLDVMRKALRAKFTTHTDLKEKLLGTGNALIEEESPQDSYWGIGADGKGENWSGKLLMELRDSLRA